MSFDLTTWHLVLGVGALLFVLALWRAQRSHHAFNIFDVLMDPATDKASLNAVTLAFFALLSAWVIVDRELRDLSSVDTMLLGVLGIFVAGRAVAQGVNAFKTAPDGPTTVRETREITVPANGQKPDQ